MAIRWLERMGDSSQAEQVNRAVEGDAVALTLLLKDSRRRLSEYLGRKIPPALCGQMDPDDLVQETHVEVFRHIQDFAPRGSESFDRWVMAIAVAKLRDALKRLRTAKRGGGQIAAPIQPAHAQSSVVALLDLLAGPGRTPSQSLAGVEAQQALQSALNDLPQHYRQAIWLVYLQGWSVAATAAEMGRTERAIHGLCRRGIESLRTRLGDASRFFSSG